MNTTQLFEFRFVDREFEQEKLKNFLSKNSTNALWLKGNRGLGKTKFFHYVLREHDEFALCYIDIKPEQNSIEILSDFIKALQKHFDEDFITTVSKKYKNFYNQTYKQTKHITKEAFPEISKIVSIILDLGYYVVNKYNENKNSFELVNDYISLILEKKKLCICIDNFSRCNIELAQHFFRIIKKFIGEANFKACIVTTSEDLQNELKEAIFFHLPHIAIDINRFGEYYYFFQILEPKFEMEQFSDTDLNYLYNKCEGSPKKLSTVISKLLERNGITLYEHAKAKIDKTKLFEILQNNHVYFEESDFSPVQKWILFSFLCLTPEINVEQLKNLALYISKRIMLYNGYNETVFDTELLLLIDHKILSYNAFHIVSTHHDLDYIELMEIFNKSQFKGMFSQYAYEFLLQHKNYHNYEELLCRHSREANISNWEIINFRYAKRLFRTKQIYDSYKILSCLEKSMHKLHPLQILFTGLVAYETGNYELTIKKLELLQLEQLRFPSIKYYYLFYLGKSYNNIGKIKDAILILKRALEMVPQDSLKYVQTLNVLHMLYFEIPEKLEESEKLFLHIQKSYKNLYPEAWANTMRGCHNFLDNTTALNILQEAIEKLGDEVEKAFVKNTRGFVLVKINRLCDAEKEFYEASKIIRRLRIHEFSYAANNLALCYMLVGKYNQAKKILLEALLWNKTNYGSLVIQTHLMICTLYLSQLDEADYYYDFLKNYMETHKIVDPIINRKIYMNLAIYCSKTNRAIMKKTFFDKATTYVKNSSSEWRYNILTNTTQKNLAKPKEKYILTTAFDPWFLVYAHD